MDIVQTLHTKIQSLMNEQTFEINAALANPADKDAFSRLETATRKYALLSEQFNTLSRLAQQMSEAQQMQQNSEKPVDK